MKRYAMDWYMEGTLGGPACNVTMMETSDGEWVRHDEAQAEIARLQHVLSQEIAANMATEKRLHAMVRVLRADAPSA